MSEAPIIVSKTYHEYIYEIKGEAFEAGRKAGLEEAAKVAEDHDCSECCDIDIDCGGGCAFQIADAISREKDERMSCNIRIRTVSEDSIFFSMIKQKENQLGRKMTYQEICDFSDEVIHQIGAIRNLANQDEKGEG